MPDINDVIAAVSNGHAYYGADNHAGHLDEFRSAGFQVNKPEDVAKIMQETLNHPDTKAAMNVDNGDVIIVNSKTGVVIALSPSDHFHDPGSTYPTNNPDKYDNMLKKLKSEGMVVEATNLEQVNAMVEKFTENTEFSKETIAKMESDAVQDIKNELDANAKVKGYIIPTADDVAALDSFAENNVAEQRKQIDAEKTAQAERTVANQEAAELRKDVSHTIDTPENAIIEVAEDGKSAQIIDKDGNSYDLEVKDDGKVSMKGELADGRKIDVEFTERQSRKLLKNMPDFKGVMGELIGPALVFGAVLTTGASPAEAAEAAVDSVFGNTREALRKDNVTAGDIAVGVGYDAASMVASETVEAVKEGKSTLAIIGAAAEDVAEGAGCVVGGGAGAALGATVSSPTVIGVPVATGAGAVGGCAIGSAVVDKTIDGGKAAVGYVIEKTPEMVEGAKNAASYVAHSVADGANDAKESAVEVVRAISEGIDATIAYYSGDQRPSPLPEGVIDRTSDIADLFQPDASYIAQSSTGGTDLLLSEIAKSDRVQFMINESEEPMTLLALEEKRASVQNEQNRAAAQQAEQQRYLDQWQMNNSAQPR
ncbi:MAG: hypothetical protein OEY94_00410 [Alphaproteobacteria bacterium]|nr:hypothetical protein [Alphaproteobacteria bacterium]